MDTELYRSLDFLVTDKAGVLTLQQRNQGALLIGAGSLGCALVGWLARGFVPHAYALLLTWFAAITLLCGLLLVLKPLLRPGVYRFDPHSGLADLAGRVCPLAELSAPRLEVAQFGDSTFHSLVVQRGGKRMMLMTSTSESALDPVLTALQTVLGASEGAQVVVPGDSFVKSFVPIFLVVLGILWSGLGYLTARHLVLGGDNWGVLLWPFGLWLAALGVLDWLGLRIADAVLGLQEARGRLTIIGLLWFLSYYLICRVD